MNYPKPLLKIKIYHLYFFCYAKNSDDQYKYLGKENNEPKTVYISPCHSCKFSSGLDKLLYKNRPLTVLLDPKPQQALLSIMFTQLQHKLQFLYLIHKNSDSFSTLMTIMGVNYYKWLVLAHLLSFFIMYAPPTGIDL